jgi:hypothetical protein
MTNNKLYTQEQVFKAIQMADKYHYLITSEECDIVNSLTPIQLPSDEEIREERLLQFPDSEYANRANDRLAFYCGAKFVINKFGGNNEME